MRLLTILTIGIITLACSRERTNVDESSDKKRIDDTENIFEKYEPVRESILETELTADQRNMVTLYKSIYDELIEFKDTDKFRQFGFSQSGYGDWLDKVTEQMDKQRENEKLKIFSLEREIFFGDLHVLGLDYVFSEGEETSQTKEGRKRIYRVLNPLKIGNEIPPSGKENYERIKQEYELFGKWIMNIKMSNELHRYRYEIYRKGNNYIGFEDWGDGEYDAEILDKKGTFFVIKGDNVHSRNGEYYRIDEDMNMVLFDQDGELTEHGFTASKEF